MENPNVKTQVVHSQTKSAWNVIGTELGGDYKIARVPYPFVGDEELASRYRNRAFKRAEFISWCFNNSDIILKK